MLSYTNFLTTIHQLHVLDASNDNRLLMFKI